MSSPSNNSRRSQMPNNQPPRPQREGATVGASETPQAINEEAARVPLSAITNRALANASETPQALNRAITDRVLANFRNESARNQATATSPDNLIETMNASLDAIRAAAGNEPPPRPMRTARQAAAIENRLGRLDDLIRALRSRVPPVDSAPPYTVLPSEGEVTMEMSVPEPEYTPPYTPLGLFGQGQKRKQERELDYEEVVEDDVEAEDRDFSRSCAPSPESTIPQRDTSCPGFAVEDDGDASDEEEHQQEGNGQDEKGSD